MSEVIVTFNKSYRDDIRISLLDFKGKKYIDIRLFVETEKKKIEYPQRRVSYSL